MLALLPSLFALKTKGPLVGSGGDDELVFERMRAGIDLIEAREKVGQRVGRGWLVTANGHLSCAPLAGLDDFALVGHSV